MSKRLRPKNGLPNRMINFDAARAAGDTSGLVPQGERLVAIDTLIPDPRNERKTFDDDSLAEMADSIRQHGILENIVATPVEDGYLILAGHRRFEGAKRAGLKQVKVTLKVPDTEHQRRLLSIVSNVQRENVGPIEMAEGLRCVLDNDPEIKMQDDLARRLGKRKDWVSRHLKILDLPDELKAKVGPAQLNSDLLARIARVDEPALQNELVDDLLAGASKTTIREKIGAGSGKSQTQKTKQGTDADDAKLAKKSKIPTSHDAYVVIQPTSAAKLTPKRQVAILEDALAFARGKAAPSKRRMPQAA